MFRLSLIKTICIFIFLTIGICKANQTQHLYDLAKASFDSLLPAETRLLADIEKATIKINLDSISKRKFDKSRIIRADLITWLCTDEKAEAFINIYGGLLIRNAYIKGKLNLSDVNIKVGLNFDKCTFSDDILINNSQFKELYLNGSHVTNIYGNDLNILGCFNLLGLTSNGVIYLGRAKIGGNLDFSGAKLKSSKEWVLNASDIVVDNNVFFREGFSANRTIVLIQSRIGGTLECKGGIIYNKNGNAIVADKIKVNNGISFDDFSAFGTVDLQAAQINGGLSCIDSRFDSTTNSIFAMFAKITGRTVFNCDTISGIIDFTNADLEALILLTSLNSSAGLNLACAHIETYIDDSASWPNPGRLILQNLQIDHMYDNDSKSAEARIGWIRRCKQFSLQPYNMVALNLEKQGFNTEAKKILIWKEDDLFKYGALPFWTKLGLWLFGTTIDYGYNPEKAIWISLVIIIFWALLYKISYCKGLLLQTKEGAVLFIPNNINKSSSINYPGFNSLLYSFETFIPFLNFHFAEYWKPIGLCQFLYWCQVVFGWILTSFLIIALTKLIR